MNVDGHGLAMGFLVADQGGEAHGQGGTHEYDGEKCFEAVGNGVSRVDDESSYEGEKGGEKFVGHLSVSWFVCRHMV